jgi:hypothetical protein
MLPFNSESFVFHSPPYKYKDKNIHKNVIICFVFLQCKDWFLVWELKVAIFFSAQYKEESI